MAIKAVLFDMDGVLIDSETFYCDGTYDWMKQLGYTGSEEAIYTMIGTTMEVTYQILQKLLKDSHSLDEIRQTNETYFKEHPLPYKTILKSGVKELLIALKEKGIKTAVCSSSPKETIQQVLDECQLNAYFDFFVSGDQFVESKPHPEIYLHAAEVLSVQPEECIVIEDSTLGIQAGRNAKMEVIALRDEKFNLDQSKANRIVNSMQEAAAYLFGEVLVNTSVE